MTEPLRDRFAAILRMHFAADDPGSMSAIAARLGESLVDEDWLLVADELAAAALAAEAQEGEGRLDRCHAGCDGDCSWNDCPQLRDGEPVKSGRHCPLDFEDPEV